MDTINLKIHKQVNYFLFYKIELYLVDFKFGIIVNLLDLKLLVHIMEYHYIILQYL